MASLPRGRDVCTACLRWRCRTIIVPIARDGADRARGVNGGKVRRGQLRIVSAAAPDCALTLDDELRGIAQRHTFSTANCSAPAPTIIMWGLRSITRRARRIGFRTRLTAATAPAFSVVPSMMIASSSTWPSRLRCAPVPASKIGSSSNTTIAASTASIAEPPRSSTRQPASSARRHPARHALTASSGNAPGAPVDDERGQVRWRSLLEGRGTDPPFRPRNGGRNAQASQSGSREPSGSQAECVPILQKERTRHTRSDQDASQEWPRERP